MKSIFVSELLSSGACVDQPLPPSLLREGQSMWQALINDLLSLSDLHVHTTCDPRLTPLTHPQLTVHSVSTASQEEQLFTALASSTQGTIVIAPELDHALEQRVQHLESLGRCQLMSTPAAVALTASKWEFMQHCSARQFPVPHTVLLEDSLPQTPPLPCPCILKPVFGAGTTATYVIENPQDWQALLTSSATNVLFPSVIQPWIPGLPISLSVIIDPVRGDKLWMPAGVQNFSKLQYQGGRIPLPSPQEQEIQQLAVRLIDSIPGLRGYIGIDLLLGPGQREIYILEINPRFTTSYLGYRELASHSLVPWLLGHPLKPAISWNGAVEFDTAGNTHRTINSLC